MTKRTFLYKLSPWLVSLLIGVGFLPKRRGRIVRIGTVSDTCISGWSFEGGDFPGIEVNETVVLRVAGYTTEELREIASKA